MSTEFDTVFPDITHPKKHAFLAAYAHCGQIRRAARAAQCDWKNHYLWLAKDPVYAACFAQAQQMAGDFLEEEAIRRAVDGVQKGVWHQGALVGKERVYSDTLLIFALKGAKPAKYKESRTQVNVQVHQSETLQLLFMQLGFDHGVGHSLLLLYDAKIPYGQNVNYFNSLYYDPSNTSTSLF
jgi:hypothetical protein